MLLKLLKFAHCFNLSQPNQPQLEPIIPLKRFDKPTSKAYIAVVRLTFLETSSFFKQINELLNEEEQRQIQMILLEQPDAGAVIRGTGGARKMRFSYGSKGKRGGLRIIYALLGDKALMLLAYSKNVQADLSPDTKKELAKIIARFK